LDIASLNNINENTLENILDMIQNNSDKPSQDDLIQIRLKVIEQLKHIMEYDPNKKEDIN